MQQFRNNGFVLFSGLLLLTGGAFFLWAGTAQPPVGLELGTLVAGDALVEFARQVVAEPAWNRLHAALLAGPLLWAVGASGIRVLFQEGRSQGYGTLAAAALAIGAGVWAVSFVLSGYVAPIHAEALLAGGSDVAAATNLRANQEMVVRLALVGWLMVSLGMGSLSAGILANRVGERGAQWLLAVPGLCLGAWPYGAWLGGLFRPGPFASPLWTPTALLTSTWFMGLGTYLIARALADFARERIGEDRG